ncbi:MAG: hypothetical protein A2W93_00750 [Bacteroidetes bacterium GWF2_43_63]|nr:MAG: hypothetical protein A2W94_15180 [Bacteroidetes bacterium GWE2_42_42]OFY54127.1 MAG: hypothetical protein A2W93_00750 [Bacteroidetes bacterium GWF2_43_63]
MAPTVKLRRYLLKRHQANKEEKKHYGFAHAHTTVLKNRIVKLRNFMGNIALFRSYKTELSEKARKLINFGLEKYEYDPDRPDFFLFILMRCQLFTK